MAAGAAGTAGIGGTTIATTIIVIGTAIAATGMAATVAGTAATPDMATAIGTATAAGTRPMGGRAFRGPPNFFQGDREGQIHKPNEELG